MPAATSQGGVIAQRALAIWPRLDQRTLAGCGHDSRLIATYVASRTSLPIETIVALLEEADQEPSLFYG